MIYQCKVFSFNFPHLRIKMQWGETGVWKEMDQIWRKTTNGWKVSRRWWWQAKSGREPVKEWRRECDEDRDLFWPPRRGSLGVVRIWWSGRMIQTSNWCTITTMKRPMWGSQNDLEVAEYSSFEAFYSSFTRCIGWVLITIYFICWYKNVKTLNNKDAKIDFFFNDKLTCVRALAFNLMNQSRI